MALTFELASAGFFDPSFSKKIDNHVYMLSLYFCFYNFCRIHKTLRVTPAKQAGLADTVRDMD